MIFCFLWKLIKTKINASICKVQHRKKSKGRQCTHRVCFCISSPAAHRGLLSHLVDSGANSEVETLYQSPKKTLNFLLGLAPASPLCCVCRFKAAAVLPLAGAVGGQVRTAWAAALLSTWLHSLGERTAKLSHVSTLIPVSLQEDQHTFPKVRPLTVYLPSVFAVSSKAASSELCICSDTALPPCAGVGPAHTRSLCQRKPA